MHFLSLAVTREKEVLKTGQLMSSKYSKHSDIQIIEADSTYTYTINLKCISSFSIPEMNLYLSVS